MKKIILIITLCFIFINYNTIAQTQFSGWYENNPNNGDIVVNTAITNFVSTKMLKIDTYFEPNTGIYYFELSFGQLICSKEMGKSIIDTKQLSSGIYILKPLSYLKAIKFNIVK